MKSEALVQYIDILLNDTEPSAFGEGELYEKYDTPEEIASNPPKWVKNNKEWKKIVLAKRHSGYGGAVAHYKRHMHKYFGEDVVKDMIDAYLEEAKSYKKGQTVTVEPTGPGVKKSYPAANWIKKPTKVKLMEPARGGTLDVTDVEVDGKEETIYGFNIK